MRLTLIVTTYERPDALRRVLESITAQSCAADEVIIADDGSGEETRRLVVEYAQRLAGTLCYVRQTHEGFRLARLRNLSIAAATGDYLVFIDGDMVLHPEFLADHRRHARPGHYCQGVRIPLTATATRAVLAGATPPGLLHSGVAGRRRWYALYRPRWQKPLRYIGRWLLAVKGCNQGFWREDLLAVNGYDETFVGWGAEDKELCVRLEHFGIQRSGLLAGGIAYHLDHPPADRSRAAENRRLLARTKTDRRYRATLGVEHHGSP